MSSLIYKEFPCEYLISKVFPLVCCLARRSLYGLLWRSLVGLFIANSSLMGVLISNEFHDECLGF